MEGTVDCIQYVGTAGTGICTSEVTVQFHLGTGPASGNETIRIGIENITSNTYNFKINNLKLVPFSCYFFKGLYVLYNLCLMENLHGVLPDPVTRFDAHTFNCVCFCIGKKPCATSMAGSIAHTLAHLYSVHCTCTATRGGIFKL
jgi:hypothetical protein